jgi:hypothetical protein
MQKKKHRRKETLINDSWMISHTFVANLIHLMMFSSLRDSGFLFGCATKSQ